MRIEANFKKYIVVTSFCLLALSCNNETRAEKSGQIEIENEYIIFSLDSNYLIVFICENTFRFVCQDVIIKKLGRKIKQSA